MSSGDGAEKVLLTDEEIREKVLTPEARAKAEKALQDMREGKSGPGMTKEELSDFLREHG